MIEQILNRKFVLEQLNAVRKYLENPSRGQRRGGAAPVPVVEPADYKAALQAVRVAQKREASVSSGQPGFNPPQPKRRGAKAAPLDDSCFISRDPVISNLQSALEQYLEEIQKDVKIIDQTPGLVGRRGVTVSPIATSRTIEGFRPKSTGARRLFNKFSVTDIRWVSSAFAAGLRLFRGKHDFNSKPAAPFPVEDRARVVLVGDWGTGIERAQQVSERIEEILTQGEAENRQQHVIHLGDVYYSGWKREYEKRFLSFWPVRLEKAERISSWSLNGNHDMYSGGHDYYDFLLKDPRFKKQAQSSFFSLLNKHWRIFALDTAWKEHDLCDPQVDWLQSSLGSDSGKVILLSHHQLYSAYEGGGPKLQNRLEKFGILSSNRIRAWFWGHEHRCMLYKPYMHVQFGRCIGHGGVPVYMWHGENSGFPKPGRKEDAKYPAPGEYEYRKYIQKGLERWAYFGFAVLDFEGPSIRVQYIDEKGSVHMREEIT